MKTWRHELRLACVALQFLTRVPVPRWVGYEPQWLNAAVRYFPLVGMLVGAAGAAVLVAAHGLWPPLIAATLAVATTLWLTVAFHEDGLADTFDALLGAAVRDKALLIMKDSRIGTYGGCALAASLLLRVLLLADLVARDAAWAAAACVAAHAVGRAAAVALMALLPYAGDEAHAKAKPLARAVRAGDALCAAAFGALALGLAGVLLATRGTGSGAAIGSAGAAAAGAAMLGASAGVLLLVLVLRAWLRRRLGGYTGDTLGACEQLGEVVVLLAFSAAVGVVWGAT